MIVLKFISRIDLETATTIGVYLASFVALGLGIITIISQNQDRAERRKQKELMAFKLRFQIASELLILLNKYHDVLAENRIRVEKGENNLESDGEQKYCTLSERIYVELKDLLLRLDYLFSQPASLDIQEVFELELIIDTLRDFLNTRKINYGNINTMIVRIKSLRNVIWEKKRGKLSEAQN